MNNIDNILSSFGSLEKFLSYMESLEEPSNDSEMSAIMESVYKQNFYFKKNMMPSISTALADPKNREAIIDFVGNFINVHYKQLITPGPVHMFTFSDRETNFIYEMFGLSKAKVLNMFTEMVEETYEGESKFHMIRLAPHKLVITGMIIESLLKGYDDVLDCAEYLIGFADYPMVYRISWKQGVDEEVMEYTIAHLGNKFKVKRLNTLLNLIKYDAHKSVSTHTERLKSGYDHEYVEFIMRVRNQMKSSFIKIASEYYKNKENNATQHTKASMMDDGNIADQEGIASNISSIVESTYNKFISGTVNDFIAKVASGALEVNVNNVRNYLNMIYKDNNSYIYKFIENVVTLFINSKPEDDSVSSDIFVDFGLSLYRKISTSKNTMHKELKSILDHWMDDVIDIKKSYSRPATIISYRRAIYDYMILMIRQYNI